MTELPVIDGIIEQKPTKPNWLRVKLPIGEEYRHVRSLVDTHKLHTICESGNCPVAKSLHPDLEIDITYNW